MLVHAVACTVSYPIIERCIKMTPEGLMLLAGILFGLAYFTIASVTH